MRALHECCGDLAKGLYPGTDIGWLLPNARKQRSGSHMIYFRPVADGIVIIRILHLRQDTERALRSPG